MNWRNTSEEIRQVEILDRGNISTRLVRCPQESEIQARFTEPIALVRTLMPEAEAALLSSPEIAFAATVWNLLAHG